MELTRRDIIRGSVTGVVVAVGVGIWTTSAAAGVVIGLVLGMFAGNWRAKATKWLAAAMVVALIAFFFWFAGYFRESFMKGYRTATMSNALSLILAEDSMYAVRKTFTRDLALLHFGSDQGSFPLKISEADSAHWTATVGDSMTSGACTLSARRWAGPGIVRSQEDFNAILHSARCTDKRMGELLRAQR